MFASLERTRNSEVGLTICPLKDASGELLVVELLQPARKKRRMMGRKNKIRQFTEIEGVKLYNNPNNKCKLRCCSMC